MNLRILYKIPSALCELSAFSFWECLFGSTWYVPTILIVTHVNILTVMVIKMHEMISSGIMIYYFPTL